MIFSLSIIYVLCILIIVCWSSSFDILAQADIITPNQFEVEQLTGITIRTIQDAQSACAVLHNLGVSTVLITSIVFPDAKVGNTCCNDDTNTDQSAADSIGMFASHRQNTTQSSAQSLTGQSPGLVDEYTEEQYILYSPKFPGQFTGTGDVCAALFLAWTADVEVSPLAVALEKLAGKYMLCRAITSGNIQHTHLCNSNIPSKGTMNAIVQRTSNAAKEKRSNSSSSNKAKQVSSRELQLIQSRDDILCPPRVGIQASKVLKNGSIA